MKIRDITKVIDAVLKEIPEKHPKRAAFVEKLNFLKRDAKYKAPEQMSGCWNQFSAMLNANIPFPPEEKWQLKIADIMADKIDVGAYYTVGG